MKRPSLQLIPLVALLCSAGIASSAPAPSTVEPVVPVKPQEAPTGPLVESVSPHFVQPASDEVSEELRAAIEQGELVAENGKKKKKKKAGRSGGDSRTSSKSDNSDAGTSSGDERGRGKHHDERLVRARQLASEGKYREASKILFPLSRSLQYDGDTAQIKYILGMVLYEMKLYQTAAFVFYDVVRHESAKGKSSRYLRQSLEKLSLAADALDSDVLLKYAIKKVDENEFPAVHRDMLYFRTGEIKLADKEYHEAARVFGRVKSDSLFFTKARYKQALAFAEGGELDKAQAAFDDLLEISERGGVTDVNRVSALLGKARVLYQRQNWDAALDVYREVPRDTEQWHEALFESTWAMLRSARFRSALSNFHSLHSDFYEDFYLPESLILRAIVYVYICRYDEMSKVLNLFDRIYRPVRRTLAETLKNNREPRAYYKEIARIKASFDTLKANRQSRGGLQIPFLVARHILKEGDVRHYFNYLARLEEEKQKIEEMQGGWASSAIGLYAKKIVDKRTQSTESVLGKIVRRHLFNMASDLRDLAEQKDLLVVETLSGKREVLKKEIAGKGLVKAQIESVTARDFLIQNGYEYWPFTGEYWLDEIGNYHYLGAQACE